MSYVEKEENAVQSYDNMDKSEEKEKAFYRKKKTKNNPKKHVWKKKAFFYLVTGTLVIAGFLLFPFLINRQKTVWQAILFIRCR